MDIAAGLQREGLAILDGDGERLPTLVDLRADGRNVVQRHRAEMVMHLAEHRIGGPDVEGLGGQAEDDRSVKGDVRLLGDVGGGGAGGGAGDEIVADGREPMGEADRGGYTGVDGCKTSH